MHRQPTSIVFSKPRPFALQVEVAEIVVHKADEPNALVDFPDAELLPAGTVEMLILLRCRQRWPQAVTTQEHHRRGEID